MTKSKHPNFGGSTPLDLNSTTVSKLPLAWDWRFRKINGNSLSEFAKYIHWIIDCDATQGVEDAVTLLQELVEKARYENE